jgi:hypothetical protein
MPKFTFETGWRLQVFQGIQLVPTPRSLYPRGWELGGNYGSEVRSDLAAWTVGEGAIHGDGMYLV